MKHRRAIPLVFALALIGAACTPGGAATQAPSAPAGSAPMATDMMSQPASMEPSMGASPDDRADWPDSIVLGLVPSREADVLVENAQPLADALAGALGIEVESFVPQNYTGLVEAMGAGQADIGAFGPGALVLAEERYGVEIILQSERFGSATYHTQWMTNDPDKYCQDEPVADDEGLLGCNGTTEATEGPLGEESLALVEGATVAWVDPTSASGFLFPAAQLIDAGLDHEADVQGIFAGGHDAAVIAVLDGTAEVGVSFDDARGGILEERPEIAETVVTFAFSPEIPNDGWTVRSELPDSLKDAIKQALLDYAGTEEGAATLNAIYEIDALVEADQEAFEVVRETAEKVGIPIED